MTEQPWYPASWLDADGKPLPSVHEVTPGEWPPCKPDDRIEWTTVGERSLRKYGAQGPLEAVHLFWGKWAGHIVAIRIIERAA